MKAYQCKHAAKRLRNIQECKAKLVLQAVLRRLLADRARLRRMQDALAAHQHLFLWAASEDSGGVLASLEHELAIRAAHLADGPLLTLS